MILKEDFKWKLLRRDKEDYDMLLKSSVHQEYIPVCKDTCIKSRKSQFQKTKGLKERCWYNNTGRLQNPNFIIKLVSQQRICRFKLHCRSLGLNKFLQKNPSNSDKGHVKLRSQQSLLQCWLHVNHQGSLDKYRIIK